MLHLFDSIRIIALKSEQSVYISLSFDLSDTLREYKAIYKRNVSKDIIDSCF